MSDLSDITELKKVGWVTDLFRRLPPWITANGVSYARAILALPIAVATISAWFWTAFAMFAIAAISDFVDGAIAHARNGHERSEKEKAEGAFLDPLADKVVVVATTASLFPWYPTAMAAVNRLWPSEGWPLPPAICYLPSIAIMAIEAALLFVRWRTMRDGTISPTKKVGALTAKSVGKVKMVVQVAAIAALLACCAVDSMYSPVSPFLGAIGVILLWVAASLSVASLASHLRTNVR